MRSDENPSLRLASCCKVDVVKGGEGRCVLEDGFHADTGCTIQLRSLNKNLNFTLVDLPRFEAVLERTVERIETRCKQAAELAGVTEPEGWIAGFKREREEEEEARRKRSISQD